MSKIFPLLLVVFVSFSKFSYSQFSLPLGILKHQLQQNSPPSYDSSQIYFQLITKEDLLYLNPVYQLLLNSDKMKAGMGEDRFYDNASQWAMAEVAVHFTLATLPNDYVMTTIFVPDDISLQKLNITDLPLDWNTFPHPITTQAIGDKFIADNKYCVLQIPSAVTQGDYNLLINPNHPKFKKIKIIATEKFPFDKRIFE